MGYEHFCILSSVQWDSMVLFYFVAEDWRMAPPLGVHM